MADDANPREDRAPARRVAGKPEGRLELFDDFRAAGGGGKDRGGQLANALGAVLEQSSSLRGIERERVIGPDVVG